MLKNFGGGVPCKWEVEQQVGREELRRRGRGLHSSLLLVYNQSVLFYCLNHEHRSAHTEVRFVIRSLDGIEKEEEKRINATLERKGGLLFFLFPS